MTRRTFESLLAQQKKNSDPAMQEDARNDTAMLVKNVISRDRICQKFTIFKNSQFEKFRIEIIVPVCKKNHVK